MEELKKMTECHLSVVLLLGGWFCRISQVAGWVYGTPVKFGCFLLEEKFLWCVEA